MSEQKSVIKRPVDRLKEVINSPTVQEQFRNALGENSGLFVSSLIDLYRADNNLQECNPAQVVSEALTAATLRLPINKSLGFAYVIPYKHKGQAVPQFQIGYKGLIQLAIRSGQFRRINADKVFEGELKKVDKLTGELELGEPTGGTVVGYFAFIELINGFRKVTYWTKEQVQEHAKRFSKAYGSSFSPWKSDFDAMATKTALKQLLGKYGIMSIEMVSAFDADRDDEAVVQDEVSINANLDFLDIEAEPDPEHGQENDPQTITPEEAAEIEAREAAEAEADQGGGDGPGPGF